MVLLQNRFENCNFPLVTFKSYWTIFNGPFILFLAYFQYDNVRALSVRPSVTLLLPWGWPIKATYGSIDSLWPKDLNQERIFFGSGPSLHGEGLKSNFLCISYRVFFGSRILKVYKYTKHDLRHSLLGKSKEAQRLK
jgi:hypothetical protein